MKILADREIREQSVSTPTHSFRTPINLVYMQFAQWQLQSSLWPGAPFTNVAWL